MWHAIEQPRERTTRRSRKQGADEICRPLGRDGQRSRGIPMEIIQMDKVYRGVAEGIGDDGALLLEKKTEGLRR